MIKNKTGVWGEIFTSRYLRDRGYNILSTNYICRFGEVDVIAQKEDTVCFVEVKTRNVKSEIRPVEAVDAGKIDRVRMTAKNFISFTKIEAQPRFDVCEVYLDDNNALAEINYIENAF